ncbi:hypothetical protein ACTS93_15255 [Empedobacter falsenii]
MMTAFSILAPILFCIGFGYFIGKILKTFCKRSKGVPPIKNIPPPPCKQNDHDYVPNGYDDFADYFKCRKCGTEKRESFIK